MSCLLPFPRVCKCALHVSSLIYFTIELQHTHTHRKKIVLCFFSFASWFPLVRCSIELFSIFSLFSLYCTFASVNLSWIFFFESIETNSSISTQKKKTIKGRNFKECQKPKHPFVCVSSAMWLTANQRTQFTAFNETEYAIFFYRKKKQQPNDFYCNIR